MEICTNFHTKHYKMETSLQQSNVIRLTKQQWKEILIALRPTKYMTMMVDTFPALFCLQINYE